MSLEDELRSKLDEKVNQIRREGEQRIKETLQFLQPQSGNPQATEKSSGSVASNQDRSAVKSALEEQVKTQLKKALKERDDINVSNPEKIVADVGKKVVEAALGSIF